MTIDIRQVPSTIPLKKRPSPSNIYSSNKNLYPNSVNTEDMELGGPIESSSLSTSSLSPNSSSTMKDEERCLPLNLNHRGRSSPPASPASGHSSNSQSPLLQHPSSENNNKSDPSSASSASALQQTLAAHNKSSGFMITDILSRSNAADLSVAAAAGNAAALQAAAASFPGSFQAAAAAAALSMHAMQAGRLSAAGLRATDLSQVANDLSHNHSASSAPNFQLPVPPNHLFASSPHHHSQHQSQHPFFNQHNGGSLPHHDGSSDDNLSDDENGSTKDNYDNGKIWISLYY